MFLLLVTAPFLLPESRGTRAARFDWLSSLLALGTVIPVIAGIKSAAADGWSTARGPVCGRRGARRASPSCGVSSPPRCRCSTCVPCTERAVRRVGGRQRPGDVRDHGQRGDPHAVPPVGARASARSRRRCGASSRRSSSGPPHPWPPCSLRGSGDRRSWPAGSSCRCVGFVLISRVDAGQRAVARARWRPAWCPAAWSPSCRSSPTTSWASPRPSGRGRSPASSRPRASSVAPWAWRCSAVSWRRSTAPRPTC